MKGVVLLNQERRRALQKAQRLLEDASEMVSQIMDEERDAFDNLPENLQDSERGSKMEDAIDAMESAIDSISEAIQYLDDAAQ